MIRRRELMTVLVGTGLMFFYYGVVQILPFGAGAARNFSSTLGEAYVMAGADLREAPPGSWVTDAFDVDFVGRASTLATDGSFSWIFSVPRDGYDLARYFALHALTQLGVATCLLLALVAMAPLPRRRRLSLVGLFGVAAAVSSHGAMMNWIGVPPSHGIGESVHLVVSWLLAALVMDRLRARCVLRESSG